MKKRLIGILALACSLVLCSTQLLASDEINAHSSLLHVQIDNATGKNCKLLTSPLMHGVLISLPPSAIMANDSKGFDLQQSTFYGPDLTLCYQCGATDSITFSVQQNQSMLFGKTPVAITLNANGLTLNSSALPGSTNIFSPSRGLITLTISETITE